MAGILTAATAPALQLYHDLLDFFFPPACLVCNGFPEDLPICSHCNERLVTLPAPVCSECRLFLTSDEVSCTHHDAMTVWALGLFDGYYRRLLHHFKFKDRMDAGCFLGKRLAASLCETRERMDALVSVPLHPARQRERGYNQSEVLARTLGGTLDLPVAQDLIRRDRNTPSQTNLGRAQRQHNVQEAFRVPAHNWSGSRVMLVDDVLTTGSTLGACRRALMEAGITVVGAAVVALAEPPTTSYQVQSTGPGPVRKIVSGG